jgi:hypothetical protein
MFLPEGLDRANHVEIARKNRPIAQAFSGLLNPGNATFLRLSREGIGR